MVVEDREYLGTRFGTGSMYDCIGFERIQESDLDPAYWRLWITVKK